MGFLLASSGLALLVGTGGGILESSAGSSSSTYGWSSTWDSGRNEGNTTNPIVIDPVSGDDANGGTSPADAVQTMTRAYALCTNTANTYTILGMAGTVTDDTVSIGSGWQSSAGHIIISRYEDEHFIWDGSASLGSGTLVTEANKSTYDPNDKFGTSYNFTGKNVYAYSVAKSSVPEILALNVWDGSTHYPLTFMRDDKSSTYGFFRRFPQAGYSYSSSPSITMQQNGSNQRTGVTSTAFAGYTTGQMTDAVALVGHSPAWMSHATIGGYTTGTGAITFSGTLLAGYATASTHGYFTLLNLPETMDPGEFAYEDDGAGNWRIWIRTSGGAPSAPRYSTRTVAIERNQINNLTIEGIDFVGFGGNGNWEAAAVTSANGGTTQAATFKFNRCRVHRCANGGIGSGVEGYGPVYCKHTTTTEMNNNTFEYLMGIKGQHWVNCPGEISYNKWSYVEDSVVTVYDTTQLTIHHNYVEWSNWASHAGQGTIYSASGGCSRVLIAHNRFLNCGGYFTPQAYDRVDTFGNVFCASGRYESGTSSNSRNYIDQGGSAPNANQTSYCLMNWFMPKPGALGTRISNTQGALSLGSSTNDFIIRGNIIHGGGVTYPDSSGYENARSDNMYTGLSFYQNNISPYFWTLDTGETDQSASLGNVFTDADAGDFTLAGSSPIDSESGPNLSSTGDKSALESRYSGYDFDVDLDGNTITWSSCKKGPFQGDWDTQVAVTA